MKRLFIFSSDKSNKFWTIEVTGKSFTVNFGKTGTTGQTQIKDFADEASCQKEAEKLMKEKTKKGYVEQGNEKKAKKEIEERLDSEPIKAPISAQKQAELDRQLIQVCKKRDAKPISVEGLLKAGANPQAKDGNGKTALHHVVKHNYPHLISEILNLIRSKADPKAVDNFGRTPLFYFCTSGYIKAMEDLISFGIDPAHKDKEGYNALGYIISNNNKETVTAFIYSGVPLVDINPNGDTLFHYYMGDFSSSIIEKILEAGVDVNAKNKKGDTALHVAVKDNSDNEEFITNHTELMLQFKANVNLQDAEGNTAIHLSVNPERDYKDLLEAGADLTIKNNAGQTVIECIKASGWYDKDEDIKKLVDDLIATPASARKELEFKWTPHIIDENAPLPTKLNIKSTSLIKGNNGSYKMLYLGKNRIGIFGEIPGLFTTVNTETGEIAWQVEDCTSSSDDLPIAADGITYIPRNSKSFSITACDSETGKVLWDCKLSTSYYQFGTYFTLSDENIYHASIKAKKIYVVNRKTGKLTARIPLKNPLRRYAFYDILPWRDKVLGIGTKNGGNTVDLYDPETKSYEKTIIDLGEQSALAQVVYKDSLYLMTDTALLHKIDLTSGEILLTINHSEVEHILVGDYNDGHMILADDKKIRYLIQSGCGKLDLFNTYNPETDMIESSYKGGRMCLGETIMTNSNKLAYLGGNGWSKNIRIYDAEKEEIISEIELPIFGQCDNISHIVVVGGALYALQDGGNKYGKNNSVLYRLQ